MEYSEEDVASIGRAGVVQRYRNRNVHYSLGTVGFLLLSRCLRELTFRFSG